MVNKIKKKHVLTDEVHWKWYPSSFGFLFIYNAGSHISIGGFRNE